MNYKNIKLENELNTHLTKRLNRLSGWGFFKVLYRVSMGRMMGTNILLLLLVVPIIYIMLMGATSLSTILASLPVNGSFGIGTGIWDGVADYVISVTTTQNINTSLLCLIGVIPLAFILSGGFAIIRDAFWIGKIKVFAPFGRGVKANFLYALVSMVIIGGMVVGILNFYWFAVGAMAKWLAIVIVVLMSILALLITIYLFILCSVSVTYRQSIKTTLLDSWYLLWLNILPNIIHFLLAMVPLFLYLIASSTFQMLILALILMVGVFYIPFIWQTHMMKTFALFNPVEVNKKGETKVAKQQQQLPAKN